MTQHYSEDELIAYQLGEGSAAATIAAHLEQCAACAEIAESIAETLRVFSADVLPEPNLEHAWQRLRGSLPVLQTTRTARRQQRWRGSLAWISGSALMVCALSGFIAVHVHREISAPAVHVEEAHVAGAGSSLGPGPLTAQPQDPELAAHLSSAERLLTEVNHANGMLDEPTRERAQQLLIRNALYVQHAQRDGDPAEASVLEELGRTLTALEHEPHADEHGVHMRMEMNTNGLLLDLRILEQNDSEPAKDDRQ